jgi:tetratricopeptide (TPR) repeat protein
MRSVRRLADFGRLLPVRIAALAAVAAAGTWILIGAAGAACAASHAEAAAEMEDVLADNRWEGTADEYAALARESAAAVACQPDNAEYRYWHAVYGWQSLRASGAVAADGGRIGPDAAEVAEGIIGQLNEARLLCPTYAQACCVAGQIEQFAMGRPEGSRHIRMAQSMAACDAVACYAAGVLSIREGRMDDSLADFRRCLTLEPRLVGDIVRLYMGGAHRPDLAVATADSSPHALLAIAAALNRDAATQPLAAQARRRAVSLLKEQCSAPGVPASSLAFMAAVACEDGDWNAAAEYYRQALAIDYGQAPWHLSLAHALAMAGRAAEAAHEARVCLRLRPDMTDAERLIARLESLRQAQAGAL